MNREVLSALIGLVGAINNNGKTESTDAVIRRALLQDSDNSCIDEIHREKYKISPNCASCNTPCGNTSDYPMEAFDAWSDEQKQLKEQVMAQLQRIAGSEAAEAELPDIVLKAIAYLGYNLGAESYRKLLEEMN